MEKSQLLGSILNYLTADVITVDKTQCATHWREYNYIPSYSKMYYILKGEGHLIIDGKDYFPKPGQICIMPEGVKQSFEAVGDDPYLKYWTHFTCSSGGRSIFSIIDVPFVIDIGSDATRERIEYIFREMIALSTNKTFTSNIMLESYIRELISIYLDQAGIENVHISQSKDNERQSAIIKYINSNLDKKISVEDIAEEVYLHPNYFIKYFKKSFGISPAKYISKKKIETACGMLHREGLNVSEVALRLGYNDIYHFSKSFKKMTGFSPSYYKKYIAPGRGV